jgi:hypothetical protein
MPFGECMNILYFIEIIMLIDEMLILLLTRKVKNISGTVRYYNERIAG